MVGVFLKRTIQCDVKGVKRFNCLFIQSGNASFLDLKELRKLRVLFIYILKGYKLKSCYNEAYISDCLF